MILKFTSITINPFIYEFQLKIEIVSQQKHNIRNKLN
jgi:hypothetical protein